MDTSGRRSPGLFEGLFIWLGMYLCANVALMVALALTGRGDVDQTQVPIWATAVAVTAMWSVLLFAVPRYLPYEERSTSRTLGDWVSVRDVTIGVPLGFASQYILMNVVNWPLMKLFPDSFSFDDISQRATDLTNTAPGA